MAESSSTLASSTPSSSASGLSSTTSVSAATSALASSSSTPDLSSTSPPGPPSSSSITPLSCADGLTSTSTWQNSVATPVCLPNVSTSAPMSISSTLIPATASDTPSNGTFTSISTSAGQPTATAPSGHGTKSDGLGGGAVAGVAIACLIGGAAIAAAVLFFLFRRKKKPQSYAYGNSHLGHDGGYGAPEKSPVVPPKAISSDVDNFLPQPIEDDAITQELSKIRDNLKNHVRSYYHNDPIRVGSFDASTLSGLAAATGMHTSVLATLLSDASTRNEATRVFLAWVVLSKCDGSRLPSLLPDDLSTTAVALQNKEGANAGELYFSLNERSVLIAPTALVSKWKAITGALLQQQPRSASRAIAVAINEANAVLAPFVRGSMDGGQRQKNLEMILSRAASLAFVLFSQPGSYRFDFAGSGNSLVTFPALLQVIGDDARTLNPPRVLWQREVNA
ncbi:hypothetical protein BDV96DRAFT_374254 [Lophiotrema nucula]|uniref:Uncharacterized protein n=1 Tax=Lophiotrema nucula TaxID=690887 RepID=A0A6A5YDV4_9PLEO|nr:hypothetical protein BDV96DRAFT_374254 [Lophiotrema nucula]